MGVKIDLRYWMMKYEDDYPADTGCKYPIFLDKDGVENEERSPHFGTMSIVLQKRGYLLKKEFVSMCKWKTERQKGKYVINTDEEIKSVTMKALKAPNKYKMKILCQLKGVGVPVASAILTMIYPKEYCVIDYRTWRALLWLRCLAAKKSFIFTSYREYSDFLDRYDSYGNLNVYFEFLHTLKKIGERRNMTPRQVEMALWKFDQYKGEKPKNERDACV